ncbi:hypothetical protein DPMN_074207 [Dreissena polymorpha]|uniref:Uncharacterized protein n=1 Tax=Dreissena polymorpha TaxID=45954 RepID=A0A9D3YIR9_DREPO|nr:hypothetical protein DPMN_074207 [Dreissena polymorpha]
MSIRHHLILNTASLQRYRLQYIKERKKWLQNDRDAFTPLVAPCVPHSYLQPSQSAFIALPTNIH